MVTAAKFEVEWPTEPDHRALVRSHFGARRFAFNCGLAQVKADLDAKTVDPTHESVGWDRASLRKAWNRAKHEVAPWWAQNSKEAYSCGLADLAYALSNWSDSKQCKRQGRRVGFPRFKAGRRDADRVRFTTGAMRLEPDRRTITVPVIGPLRAKENTRRVQRHLASGRAHILNMTLSQRWGRLFVSISYALRTPTTACTVAQPAVRAGVDLGMHIGHGRHSRHHHRRGNTDGVSKSGPAQGDACRSAAGRSTTFPPHPRLSRIEDSESQAGPPRPPLRASPAGSCPPAHH
jgi:putative transposase